MIDSQLLTFLVVAAVLTVTPGVDTMLVLRNVVRGGRNQGIATTFGICSGLFVHALLSALGLSAVLMHTAEAFYYIKIVGALYLVWLGIQSFRTMPAETEKSLGVQSSEKSRGGYWRKCFLEGFLSNVLNPKAIVFYLAFLPQFIAPGESVLEKSLFLTGIHFTMGILWLGALSQCFERVRGFIVKPSFNRWSNRVCGFALIGFGIGLAMEKR